MNKFLGIMLLVIGIVLFGFGLNSSNALAEQVVEGVTGRYTEHTMWYLLGGIGMIIGGIALVFTRFSKE